MIEKLKPLEGLDHSWLNKINELCDAVNELNQHLLFLRKKVLEIQTTTEPNDLGLDRCWEIKLGERM